MARQGVTYSAARIDPAGLMSALSLTAALSGRSPDVRVGPQPDSCTAAMRDAVGTLITERPPHKAVRAAFPHTASTLGV